MLDKIVSQARDQNKHILIISAPRSGTHATAAELAVLGNFNHIGEICKVGYSDNPWEDIDRLFNQPITTIAQVVQLTPKLSLAENVKALKDNSIIVNIRRRNKVDQFASWTYFRQLDPTGLHGWHNHTENKTRVEPGSIIASEQDISLFKIDQIINDFFDPDFSIYYEDLGNLQQQKFRVNQFSFPLRNMFKNLDFVESELGNWKYAE